MKRLKQSVQLADKHLIHHADYTFEVQKHSEGQHRTDGEEGRESNTHKRPKDKDRAPFQLAAEQRTHWAKERTLPVRGKTGEGDIKDEADISHFTFFFFFYFY